jgi:hypothetical protein
LVKSGYNSAPVKTVQDLLEKQLVVGDTGPGTGTRSYPKAPRSRVDLTRSYRIDPPAR